MAVEGRTEADRSLYGPQGLMGLGVISPAVLINLARPGGRRSRTWLRRARHALERADLLRRLIDKALQIVLRAPDPLKIDRIDPAVALGVGPVMHHRLGRVGGTDRLRQDRLVRAGLQVSVGPILKGQ